MEKFINTLWRILCWLDWKFKIFCLGKCKCWN